MKKGLSAFFLIFLFFSCDPTKMSGKEDAQVLSVILQSEKSVYEYGETITLNAAVASQLSTARLYHWYTDGHFEPTLVNDTYSKTPDFVSEMPYLLSVTVKVRVGIYVAVAETTVTVNPPPEIRFDFLVNGESPQTQLLLYGETLKASVHFPDGAGNRSCCFFWDSTRLSTSTEWTMTMDERHFGTHRFSVTVSDGKTESRRSCTVKVGAVVGAVNTDEPGLLNAVYGTDLTVKAFFRSVNEKYRLLSVDWFIGAPQAHSSLLTPIDSIYLRENGLELQLPGSSNWLRPADASGGKQYQLRAEFCFSDESGEKQTLIDSVLIKMPPYVPLKIENLILPKQVSFYEYRNGAVVAAVAVSGGRKPLTYQWKLDGEVQPKATLARWKLPRPNEPAENPQLCAVEVIVSDGLTEVIRSAQMQITNSDAPQIFRFYAGDAIRFDAATVFADEVFAVVSRIETTAVSGGSSPRVTAAVSGSSYPKVAIARGADALNTQKTFTVSGRAVPAVLRRMVKDASLDISLEIWVAENCWSSGAAAALTEADLNQIADAFLPTVGKGIYRQTTEILGEAWGTLPAVLLVKYIDYQKTFSILLCDIDDDKKTDFSTGAVAGIFEPKNCFLKTMMPTSDEKLLLSIDAPLFRNDAEMVLSTAAHEFAHLVSFYQKELSQYSGTKTMARWLNEMISMGVEDLIADSRGWKGPRGFATRAVPEYPPYLTSGRLPPLMSDLSLPLNPISYESPSAYENYANGYAFIAFLMRNYPHPELLKKILKNTDNGFAAVLTGLKNCGFDISGEDLFADFGTALVLSEMQALPAVSGKRLNAGESGFSYSKSFQLGSVDLNIYQKGTQIGPFFLNKTPEIKQPSKNYSHLIYRMSKENGFSSFSGIVPGGCVVTLIQK